MTRIPVFPYRDRQSFDHSMTYTTGPFSVEDRSLLPHRVMLHDIAVPLLMTDWCKSNCDSLWGWWFDHSGKACFGFADREEMVWFCVCNDYVQAL